MGSEIRKVLDELCMLLDKGRPNFLILLLQIFRQLRGFCHEKYSQGPKNRTHFGPKKLETTKSMISIDSQSKVQIRDP